jgi:hypothetical protein
MLNEAGKIFAVRPNYCRMNAGGLMDFMALLLFSLTIGYLGVNVWDRWDESEKRRPQFLEAGRFLLPQYIIRHMVAFPKESAEPQPDAKFAIQNAGIARRCEVCHQADSFDTQMGYCYRCSHHTV